MDMTIEEIEKIIKASKYKKKDIADLFGITPRSLSKKLKGQHKFTKLEILFFDNLRKSMEISKKEIEQA